MSYLCNLDNAAVFWLGLILEIQIFFVSVMIFFSLYYIIHFITKYKLFFFFAIIASLSNILYISISCPKKVEISTSPIEAIFTIFAVQVFDTFALLYAVKIWGKYTNENRRIHDHIGLLKNFYYEYLAKKRNYNYYSNIGSCNTCNTILDANFIKIKYDDGTKTNRIFYIDQILYDSKKDFFDAINSFVSSDNFIRCESCAKIHPDNFHHCCKCGEIYPNNEIIKENFHHQCNKKFYNNILFGDEEYKYSVCESCSCFRFLKNRDKKKIYDGNEIILIEEIYDIEYLCCCKQIKYIKNRTITKFYNINNQCREKTKVKLEYDYKYTREFITDMNIQNRIEYESLNFYYCSECNKIFPLAKKHCCDCYESYDNYHCKKCHISFEHNHCKKCHISFEQNHCCSCKKKYNKNENHCCDCKQNYNKNEKHCKKCHKTYSYDEIHCCACRLNYNKKYNHCCDCKQNYEFLHCKKCHINHNHMNKCNCNSTHKICTLCQKLTQSFINPSCNKDITVCLSCVLKWNKDCPFCRTCDYKKIREQYININNPLIREKEEILENDCCVVDIKEEKKNKFNFIDI
jgi:hypothetical protein